MNNHTSRRVEDDDYDQIPNERTYEASDRNRRTQLPSFQRPGPACSKSSSSPVPNTVRNQPEAPFRSVINRSQSSQLFIGNTFQPQPGLSSHPQPGPSSQGLNSSNRDLTESEETKLIRLVKKFGLMGRDNKDKKAKEQSWVVISEEFDLPVEVCKRKWKSLCERYRRIKSRSAGGGSIPHESRQFVKEMISLFPQDKSLFEGKISPVIGSSKRKRTQAGTRSSFGPTSSHVQSSPNSKDLRSDTLFAKNIALQLGLYSIGKKNLIKSRIWQVFAELGSHE